jgi:hypothetical protein
MHFLHASHVSAGEVHLRLVKVYGEEVMSCQSGANGVQTSNLVKLGQEIMRNVADSCQQAPLRTKHGLKQLSRITDE